MPVSARHMSTRTVRASATVCVEVPRVGLFYAQRGDRRPRRRSRMDFAHSITQPQGRPLLHMPHQTHTAATLVRLGSTLFPGLHCTHVSLTMDASEVSGSLRKNRQTSKVLLTVQSLLILGKPETFLSGKKLPHGRHRSETAVGDDLEKDEHTEDVARPRDLGGQPSYCVSSVTYRTKCTKEATRQASQNSNCTTLRASQKLYHARLGLSPFAFGSPVPSPEPQTNRRPKSRPTQG